MKQLFVLLATACCIASTQAQWNTTGNAATSSNFVGTTNNIPLRFRTNNVQRMIIDSLGRVGVGIVFPTQLFTVQSSGSAPAASWITSGAPVFAGYGEGTPGNADFNLLMASSTATNARGVFGMKRSRGTLAVPTAVQTNDQLGSLLVSGFDGTNFQGAAAVDFFADGTPTAGNVPVRISFVTGTNGGNRTERLRIGNSGDIIMNTNQFFLQRSSGNVGMGTITPTAKLEVAGQVKITGGTPGAGKVLTSDANGLGTWQAIPTIAETDPKVGTLSFNKVPKWGGATLTDGTITDNGNVGIGETNPQGILHVSQPFNFSGISFSGSGLNDLSVNTSGFTGLSAASYAIRINNAGPNPNLIEISNDGGATFGSPVAISNPIVLSDGVLASFAATSGHTFADQWSWTVTPGFSNILVVKNGKVGIDTASPNATLDVNGDALINGLTVGRGGGNSTINTAFGVNVLKQNTSGTFNTAFGQNSMSSNTIGEFNTAVGSFVLGKNTIGVNNTAMGMQTMTTNTTGNGNTAVGAFAMENNQTGSGNVAIGGSALKSNTTARNNVAVGGGALSLNRTGFSNVAIGSSALTTNSSGSNSVAVGDSALLSNSVGENTAIGSKAMNRNTTGVNNTAVGFNTLLNNTTGSRNTAIGYRALSSNLTGSDLIAIGDSALINNTSAGKNIAIGSKAMQNNGFGTSNTALGNHAFRFNSSGDGGVAVGDSAAFSNISGDFNIAIGKSAMMTNANGSNLIAIGNRAMAVLSNPTNSLASIAIGDSALASQTTISPNIAIGSKAMANANGGSQNTAIGFNTLKANTSSGNTAVGHRAMIKHQGGDNNTVVGSAAFVENVEGEGNTVLGNNAMNTNVSAADNVAVGRFTAFLADTMVQSVVIGAQAMFSASKSTSNVAIGYNAMLVCSSSNNVVVGTKAGGKISTGNNNTAIGDSALANCSTGADNTALGYRTNPTLGSSSNTTALGANTVITAGNQVRFGASTVTSIGGQVGYTTLSDGRFKTDVQTNVPGLSFISKLRPVTYHLNVSGIDQFTNISYTTPQQLQARTAKEQLTYTGFIAQEVESAAKELKFDFSGVDKPQNDKDMYGLRYAEFVVPLVKAVQELDTKTSEVQQLKEQLQSQQSQLQNQQKQIDELKAALLQLAAQKTPCTTGR